MPGIQEGAVRLAACVVLLLLLAGCSASTDGTSEEVQDAEGPVLAGVVVDGAVVPVPRANVSLLGTPHWTLTDEQGQFALHGIEAGSHLVQVSKEGYRTVQSTVEAGKGHKFTLLQDVGLKTFFEDFAWKGFFNCAGAVQICAAPNTVLETLGQAPLTEDQFLVQYEIAGNVTWIQSELIWESTQALGDHLDLKFDSIPKQGGDYIHRFNKFGPSPVLATANETVIQAYDMGTTHDLQYRVFPAGPSPDFPNALLGLQVMQDFEIYTHLFYNYEPTAGWRFSDDPDVP